MPLPDPSTAERAAPRFFTSRARVAGVLAPFVGAVLLARAAVAGVYAKLHHPGATLDDAYIHFQYARAIAEGHPFRFQAGEPMTSGATSLLWPTLLAPFYALGLRGESLLWAAWILSFAALAMLAYEAYALTARLAGEAAGLGAGAMVLSFGGFVWCAASGMEVVPFAYLLARTARRASEWAEASPEERSRGRAWELTGLAWGTTLFRPEGAVLALFAAAVLTTYPRIDVAQGWRPRAFGLIAGAAVVANPLFLWLLTGHASSTTMVAKLMPGNPYYPGGVLWTAVLTNARLLIGTLLNGEVWSAEFLPEGSTGIAAGGLIAVAVLGWRTRLTWRAAGVVLLAILMFAPCFYVTFLWNRLRYLWPFSTGWIIGVACLCRLVGDAAGAVRPRARVAGPMLCGAFVGLLASKLDWVLEDVAQSASGIDRQQAALGRWAKEHLPEDARIGVNDTGAIAYFGDRHTFDVVGLTTAGEARYWVAGAASRFEHYERLHVTDPETLPTHFIVYPEWMACDAVLGEPLHQATVTDSTILGGQTMRVYQADYTLLGSGERSWTLPDRDPVDVLDVADLESEAEHHYDLLGANDGEQVVTVSTAGGTRAGTSVADGGRGRRRRERFVAHLHAGAETQGVMRLEANGPARITMRASNATLGTFDVAADGEWEEVSFPIPSTLAKAETPFELSVEGGPITVFHYWFFDP